MSILNSQMFKSSRSPPLSLQKQHFQFERKEVQQKGGGDKTPAESFGLERRGISDLCVVEVTHCAFIST